jgi:O-antigen/teichoic acid export membrane protein
LSFGLPPRSITVFGGTIVGNNVANWGIENLDNIAASQLGPSALGLYGRSYNLVHQPCRAIVNSVQSVLLSATAKVQERIELLGKITLSALGVILGILGPAYATLFLLPYTVIVGLYGPKWVNAVPIIAPLAIATLLYACICLLGPVLCGAGYPELEFWPQLICCGLAAVAYFSAARWSLSAVAWAVCAVTAARFLLMAWVTFRLFQIQWIKAALFISRRLLFSFGFALVPWAFDRGLALFNVSVALRLSLVFALSVGLLSACIWYISPIVFGYDTLAFLLRYGAHLPATMEKRIRIAAQGKVIPSTVS